MYYPLLYAKRYHFLIGALMLMSVNGYVAQKTMQPEQYRKWYSEHLAQFQREAEAQNLQYTVRYVPAEFALLRQMPEMKSKKELKTMRNELNQYLDFMLLVGDPKKAIGSNQWNNWALQLESRIVLVVDHRDTIRNTNYMFDQTGQMNNQGLFNFSFPRPTTYQHLEIVIRQDGGAPLVFTFEQKQLEKTPQIAWK